ncbi:MAG: T9SS type A sorting domain-containing protein [Ignavibacteriales bacterium]|nr:T9SS type A sorting domain-containing protein [Ignavibacteriales bacterium]MCF8315046.1 T9SS type A sorting domain-containing protein [Ignavibacteriales bacterium]MCF8435958.1 T9SS type A sorting domain-containing protein [Ignavibacteriales bacterium]
MKKLIIIIFLCSVSVYSQNYNLNINLRDSSTISFAVNEITRITFDNITGLGDLNNVQQLIRSFKVIGNYPNPFNPSTTIAYSIPQKSDVKVNIYDVNGQLIKEIVNESLDAGKHFVTWNGTNQTNSSVASGVYIYTVQSGSRLVSRQMILVK